MSTKDGIKRCICGGNVILEGGEGWWHYRCLKCNRSPSCAKTTKDATDIWDIYMEMLEWKSEEEK